MANSLTSLAADIYKRADVVGHELVGAIPSVTINSDAGVRVAKGDTVRSFFTRASVVNSSYTPSMTIPEGDDQTIDNKTMVVNQTANVKIPWTGEDIKHVNNGAGFDPIYNDQITQAFRGIANAIETYLCGVIRKGASRAFGTAGTTPFASNHGDIAELRRILVDNGCPTDNRITAVMNTAAGVKMRNLTQLQKANEAGSIELLRQGTLLDLQGIRFKESAGIPLVTAGTGASYLVNNGAGYAAGSTTVALDTGSGTILAGDVLTNSQSGRDTNKYVVGTALAAGSLVLNDPGTQVAWVDNDTVAVGAAFTANLCFHQMAVELVVRPPAMPPDGDAAVERLTVQDPWSGLLFELALYKGYGKQMLDITTFYDAKVWKPAFVALHLG